MASKSTIELLDDVDGKPASETIIFGLDGREFEIDLTEKNARSAAGPDQQRSQTLGSQTAQCRRVGAGAFQDAWCGLGVVIGSRPSAGPLPPVVRGTNPRDPYEPPQVDRLATRNKC
jgi:hypothetical protein